MRAATTVGGSVRVDGEIVRVDTVNRELTIHLAHGLLVIDVPPGCPITLRGERVRLRMLQARDLVRVNYVDRCGARVASAVEVRAGAPLLEPTRGLESAKSSLSTAA
jgi:hypothetical protein